MTTPAPMVEPSAVSKRGAARALAGLGWVFLRLGCSSFGGPIAHLGFLRTELVERRKWIDDARYADLVALCQFLPGPASSQVVFALGLHRAGLAGALLASACFTLPSAALMIGFALGLTRVSLQAGWLHGLALASVAVVAHAVWGMGRKLCPDRARASLCLVAAAVVLALPGAATGLGVLALGALAGFALYRRTIEAAEPARAEPHRGRIAGGVALAVFAALLLALPLLAAATGARPWAVFDAFYRAGALVFGGGHVVLPLLHAEVVPPGWLTDDQFLAGYGAAQALPGPLFTFAAYVGTAMSAGPARWAFGLWCLLAIFLPAWLLIGGALPFWHRLRARRWARAALAGANAAIVGVLLAALYDPIFLHSVRSARDLAAALLAFGLLERWKAPPWLVVLVLAVAGQLLLSPA